MRWVLRQASEPGSFEDQEGVVDASHRSAQWRHVQGLAEGGWGGLQAEGGRGQLQSGQGEAEQGVEDQDEKKFVYSF